MINNASELKENNKLYIKYKKYKNFKCIILNNNSVVFTVRFVGLVHAKKILPFF